MVWGDGIRSRSWKVWGVVWCGRGVGWGGEELKEMWESDRLVNRKESLKPTPGPYTNTWLIELTLRPGDYATGVQIGWGNR